MKTYFNFSLTGKKLLPIWLLFLALFFVPYTFLLFSLSDFKTGDTFPLYIYPSLLFFIIFSLIINFFIYKLFIENIVYNQKQVVFSGSFGKYLKIMLSGLVLSIVTLGIYVSWFIKNMTRYFVDNSTCDSGNFIFKGKGHKLFLIFLLTGVIPSIAIGIAFAKYYMTDLMDPTSVIIIVRQIIMMIILIPFMYYVYKWVIDIKYKEYRIFWETKFWPSCGKMALEIFLAIITVGIYMPLAVIRLYKYFADKTVSVSENNKKRFGFDPDQKNDFLFIWGQTLLTIVTLGIYYPWAFCKILKRILSRTYLTNY